MSLRAKTLLIIGVSLIVLTLLLSLLASSVILDRFAAYEREEVREDTERAVNALYNDVSDVERFVHDWASWDSTYAYVASQDAAFIAESMGPDMDVGERGYYFQNINMQVFIFTNTAGDIVFGRGYDRDTEQVVPLPEGLQAALTPDNPLLQHPDISQATTGILLTPEQTLIVASRPILTTEEKGPARGTVIMARYLDATKVAKLAEITNLSLTIERLDTPTSLPDMQIARGLLQKQPNTDTPIITHIVDDETIAGYATIPDIHGQSGIVIRTDSPRDIYAQGQASVYYLIGIFVASVALVGGAMVLVLQITVVARLTTMSKQVRAITTNNDKTTHLATTGHDEITSLGQDINTMLQSLAQSHEALRASEAEACAARQVAEQANEMKSRFLANMSHELRTPLNSIINFTRILSAGMRGPVNEGQVDYLNRVHASGEHLLGLINDILDLSKIEAGRMDLHLEPCNLERLLEGIMSTAIGLVKDKPVVLQQEIAPDLPTVSIDATRIRQVLLNLLSNAAKFTDAGTITVRAMFEKPSIVISVTDTGIGIPADKIESIFDEFRQVDDGSARSYEGTGLGLAICKRLIEMHHGHISVESTPGVGSTFSFSLLAQPPCCDIPPCYELDTKNGIPVLVIDDDPCSIEIVSSYLQRDGYAVYGIQDSQTVLDKARQMTPAVIILDILMPNLDGWNLLTAFKQDADLKTIPIILYSIMDEQQRGFTLGASAYLIKPIDEDLLRETVANVVGPQATILVVDDDPNMRELLSHHLTHVHGYHVVTAHDGQAGLDYIAATPPDLIILDLMMPNVDGFTVLEQLDTQPHTSAIPVIVLTARDLNHDECEYLNKRVANLLSKSITPPEHIPKKVHALLANHALH